jgi:glycosyltransferase involved in cell wall biosynthesis
MKVLFIAPHLSTGGMPAFLLKRIEAIQQHTNWEVYVVEWKCYSNDYVVQRKQIQKLLGENFYSFLGNENAQKGIIDFCYKKDINIIHIEEIPEGFDPGNSFDSELQKELYNKKHPWKVVETCHNIYFDPTERKLHEPDGYACVTPHHIENTFKDQKAKKSLITFPIDPLIQSSKTRDEILTEKGYLLKGEYHIVNIGLWTPGKNQGYALEIAKNLYEKYGYTYIFHFVGNQAPNFKKYWEPLMKEFPPNVLIWGERNDTDIFFKMSDLMLFTSNWECNPIVLKEAISNNIKIMAYNLDHYGDEYTPFITPLTGNLFTDKNNLIETIHSPIKYNSKDITNSVSEFANNHIKFYESLLNEK